MKSRNDAVYSMRLVIQLKKTTINDISIITIDMCTIVISGKWEIAKDSLNQ